MSIIDAACEAWLPCNRVGWTRKGNPDQWRSDGTFELVFTKQGVNPFFNSGLLTWLLHRGVREVVLCGVSTNMVVEASARYCDDAGFRVTVLEDGCASNKQEWHEFSVTQILPMLGRVISVDDFTRELRQ